MTCLLQSMTEALQWSPLSLDMRFLWGLSMGQCWPARLWPPKSFLALHKPIPIKIDFSGTKIKFKAPRNKTTTSMDVVYPDTYYDLDKIHSQLDGQEDYQWRSTTLVMSPVGF